MIPFFKLEETWESWKKILFKLNFIQNHVSHVNDVIVYVETADEYLPGYAYVLL